MNHKLTLLCYLSIFALVGILFINVDQASSQPKNPIETDLFTVTINPIEPVTNELAPSQIIKILETDYLATRSILNQENVAYSLNIPEGVLRWLYSESMRNITIFDSLNHYFTPIIENNTVSNPSFEIELPSNSEYRLSLHFSTDLAIFLDEQRMEYVFVHDLKPLVLTTLNLSLPKEFTILSATSGFTQYQGDQRTSLEWQQPANQEAILSVRFLPFSREPTSKAFKFTLDIPTVFPIDRMTLAGTIKHDFESLSRFSDWEIEPIFDFPILFPIAQDITVKSVYDGKGQCSEILRPLQPKDESGRGSFFVDNENKQIIVYPRYSKVSDFYEYSVEASFEFRNTPTQSGLLLWPFQSSLNFSILKVETSGKWKQNVTGNIDISFLLPPNTDPILGNESFRESIRDNRPVVSFIYNSPKELSSRTWVLVFDIIPLRDLFLIQVFSVVIFVCLVWIFKHKSYSVKKLNAIGLLAIPTTLIGASSLGILGWWYDLLFAGGSKLVFLGLFMFECLLYVSILVILFKKR